MNFKQFFNETPAWDDAHKEMGKIDSSAKSAELRAYLFVKTNGKLIRTLKYKNFVLELWDAKSKFWDSDVVRYRIFAFDENKNVVGSLSAGMYEKFKFPKISTTYVYEEYQGLGIGRAMYDLIIYECGGLISDSTLTGKDGHGSFNIWNKLSKDYHAYLIQYETSDKFTVIPVKEITRNMMKDSMTLFMVTENEF